MTYQGKTDWRYNDIVTEEDMNRIERGIEQTSEQSAKIILSSIAPPTDEPNTFWFEDLGEDS